MAKSPTLTDIKNLIAAGQRTQDERHQMYAQEFEEIKKRQNYTNGNVKDLLLWQSNTLAAQQAVEEYKKKQEAQSSSNPKADWTRWLWIAVALAAALIAIGQALGGVALR
jgi:hypothetical protein